MLKNLLHKTRKALLFVTSSFFLSNVSLGTAKKLWTPSEDENLIAVVERLGAWNWNRIAQQIPDKTDKQCRRRWVEYLDPDIQKGSWTLDEDETLIELARKLRNRWAKIAQCFSGKTSMQCKNRYRTLKKLMRTAAVRALNATSGAADQQVEWAAVRDPDATSGAADQQVEWAAVRDPDAASIAADQQVEWAAVRDPDATSGAADQQVEWAAVRDPDATSDAADQQGEAWPFWSISDIANLLLFHRLSPLLETDRDSDTTLYATDQQGKAWIPSSPLPTLSPWPSRDGDLLSTDEGPSATPLDAVPDAGGQ